ncbi:MAG: molybdopterin molybdotransferase MoeA [Micavibrio sp.]|nr:molybdopterin molybdotransferase MoeA [Micavibrio sp.]
MISYKEALAIINREGSERQLPGEWADIREISGRICAEDIVSPIANQQFDNSAMDGFAVRIKDFNVGTTMLEVAGRIVAGELKEYKPLLPGQCYEIMTGAPLPLGCDAVVPVEKTERNQEKILFRAAPRKGDHIRRAGEDFASGDIVLEKGKALKPTHILTLATLGVGKVKVLKKPRVAFISTGQEVVDDLSSLLKPGQIYNSTGPYLQTALPTMGAEILPLGGIGDDHGLYKKKLREAIDQGSDIILSTGAVSAGSEDFVPVVMKDMGAEIFFHKVAIRPGKPILFARFPDQGPFFLDFPVIQFPAQWACGFLLIR